MIHLWTNDKVYFGKVYTQLKKFDITINLIEGFTDFFKCVNSHDESFYIVDFESINISMFQDILNSKLISKNNSIMIYDEPYLIDIIKEQNIISFKKQDILLKTDKIINLLECYKKPSKKPLEHQTNRIFKLLSQDGFNMRYSGFFYLLDLIDLGAKDFSNIENLMTKGYFSVALKYKTTPSCVERSIRHLKKQSKCTLKNIDLIKYYIEKLNKQII